MRPGARRRARALSRPGGPRARGAGGPARQRRGVVDRAGGHLPARRFSSPGTSSKRGGCSRNWSETYDKRDTLNGHGRQGDLRQAGRRGAARVGPLMRRGAVSLAGDPAGADRRRARSTPAQLRADASESATTCRSRVMAEIREYMMSSLHRGDVVALPRLRGAERPRTDRAGGTAVSAAIARISRASPRSSIAPTSDESAARHRFDRRLTVSWAANRGCSSEQLLGLSTASGLRSRSRISPFTSWRTWRRR